MYTLWPIPNTPTPNNQNPCMYICMYVCICCWEERSVHPDSVSSQCYYPSCGLQLFIPHWTHLMAPVVNLFTVIWCSPVLFVTLTFGDKTCVQNMASLTAVTGQWGGRRVLNLIFHGACWSEIASPSMARSGPGRDSPSGEGWPDWSGFPL